MKEIYIPTVHNLISVEAFKYLSLNYGELITGGNYTW